MNHLLARYAESIFWMARYMERAENLARILDVETFDRDEDGAKNWLPVVRMNADEERFFTKHQETSAETVLHFYILDADNPTSILSAVGAARENARILRPWISLEMWSQINVFYKEMQGLGAKDLALHNLNRLCTRIKEACQAHTGITEGTFYRDQGWYFYQLGKAIERADQTTRLLDIKYHTLLPTAEGGELVHHFSQWNTVLRSAAGYHAFRRENRRAMTPDSVAAFMLFNESFPRSVTQCVRLIDMFLHRLKSRYNLRGGNAAMEKVDEIQHMLQTRSIDDVIRGGLHHYLDHLQFQLSTVTSAIGRDFFGQDLAAT
ncbi:MAG TPA: alpha-E domain-containing protein [Azospirillaceae bacterium]|nr:alpha-E domain-containing protein [Azospirillaceae bacterium]